MDAERVELEGNGTQAARYATSFEAGRGERVFWTVVLAACVFMSVWIVLGRMAPSTGCFKDGSSGSWDAQSCVEHARARVPVVPPLVVTKYQVRTNSDVLFTHHLGAVLWIACVVSQILLPRSTLAHRKRHRIAGMMLVFSAQLVSIGYVLIRVKNLHVFHDFRRTHAHQPHVFREKPLMNWIGYLLVDSVALLFSASSFISFITGYIRRRFTIHTHREWVARHIVLGLWVAIQRLVFGSAVFAAFLVGRIREPQLLEDAFYTAWISSLLACILATELAIHLNIFRPSLPSQHALLTTKTL